MKLRPLGPKVRPVLETQVLQWLWDDHRSGNFSCPRAHRHGALLVELLDLPDMPNAYRIGCQTCGFETPLFVVRAGEVQRAAP